MIVSVRFSDEEGKFLKEFAEFNGISVSELVRKSIFEKIEDEYDLKLYEAAHDEYLADPVTYSLEDIKKEFDL